LNVVLLQENAPYNEGFVDDVIKVFEQGCRNGIKTFTYLRILAISNVYCLFLDSQEMLFCFLFVFCFKEEKKINTYHT